MRKYKNAINNEAFDIAGFGTPRLESIRNNQLVQLIQANYQEGSGGVSDGSIY